MSNEPSLVENEVRTNTTDTELALENSVMSATSKAQTDESLTSAGDYQNSGLSVYAHGEKVDESPSLSTAPHESTLQQGISHQGSPSIPRASESLLGDQGRVPSPSIHEAEYSQKPSTDAPSGLSSTSVGHLSTSKGSQEDDRDTSDHPKYEGKKYAKQGPVDPNNDADILRLLEILQGNGKLKELGYKKATSAEPEAKEPAETTPVPKTENQFGCSTCGKNFGRRCELKCVIHSTSAQ